MSHWLYLHKDLTGHENVWKPGITLTPYSAVRARQRFSWKQFGLDYLFFGRPNDIRTLEAAIKKRFKNLSGRSLNGIGSQTEMFQIEIDKLLDFINNAIAIYNLDIIEIELKEPYTATNSGQCPFKTPSEKEAADFLDRVCEREFEAIGGKVNVRNKVRSLEKLLNEVSCA